LSFNKVIEVERMRFLQAAGWEFVQNLPLVAGFVVALELGRQGEWGAAIAGVAAGGVAGAVVIRITEPRIVAGHREPWRVTAANAIAMTVLMAALVAYLSASWSGWATDLLVGALAGVALAMVQDLAAGESIGARHCIALGSAGPLALIGIRALVATLPLLVNVLVITVVLTLIVALIDYGPLAATQGRARS